MTSEDYTQMNLFDMVKNEKLEKLDKALDSIRNKFGTDAIKRARFIDPKQEAKQDE